MHGLTNLKATKILYVCSVGYIRRRPDYI